MKFISFLNENILWGVPMLIFMSAIGVYLTIMTGGVIFSHFFRILKISIKNIFKKKDDEEGSLSPLAAISTALAATVGTGNIVGVAIAIRIGGAGAVFWMWVAALFGMVIKYSEVTLAVFYRKKNELGEYVGGPMYYMKDGLGSDFLAILFSVFAIISSFGTGNAVQANSLAQSMRSLDVPVWISGVILSLLLGIVLIGGIKRISSFTQILVPFMALFYIISALLVLFLNYKLLPDAISLIFTSAFSKSSATGGFLGATVSYAARIGVSRGLFTNEAGLGSSPIAHASANVPHPSIQGFTGAFEVFFDTIIMCTITALVILTSGVWKYPLGTPDGNLSGIAFKNSLPFGEVIVSLCVTLFAFASIVAWYYYGEKCVEFLFGKKLIPIYRVIYVSVSFFGAVSDIGLIWELSDMLNSFMAIPNLTALLLFAPKIKAITKDYFKKFPLT